NWDAGGDVHTNDGVQNYWFYLLAHGGSDTNDNGSAYSITGIGLTDAARIAYQNLTAHHLGPSSDYLAARNGSLASAIELGFNESSSQYRAVRDAWDAVGVPPPSPLNFPDFRSLVGLNLVSNAAQFGNSLRLTPANTNQS